MPITTFDVSIDPSLFNPVLIVIGLLLVATGWYGIRYFRLPGQHTDNIGLRLRYLWVFLTVFCVAQITTTYLLILYVLLLSFLGFKEFLSLTPTRRADRRVLFWAYMAIPVQYILIWVDWYAAFIAFIPTYLFLFIPLCMVIIGETEGFLRAISTISWGIVVLVYCMGHLAYLLLLQPPYVSDAGGSGLFLFLLVLSQLSHVAQYLFGKLFDNPGWRIKVTTTRNWASLVGSILVATLLSWIMAPQLTPLSEMQSIWAGVAIAFASFVGYLTLSAIKIELQLRDRGTMTPGHGGVLNRIDTVIFSAPVFFHLLSYLLSPNG